MTWRSVQPAIAWGATLLLAGIAAGCFKGEPPVPPREALAQAAARINAALAEERALAAATPRTQPAEFPQDRACLVFWYYNHPLISSTMLSDRGRLAVFQRAHPGIELHHQYIGDWAVAIQKLTVSLAAGDVPDVALVKRGWLARLVAAGRAAPLDGLLPASLLEDVQPPARRAFGLDGRLYALPADGFCSVLYYNRDVLGDTPPRTWEELRRIARQVARSHEDSEESFYAVGDVPFLEALWSAGGRVCDELACDLSAPEAAEALEFVLSLRDEGLAHPRALGSPDGAFELFLRGRVAMTVASSAYWPRAQRASFPAAMAPPPGKSGPASILSDDALVVFARYADAKKDAIAALLDWLTGPELQGQDAADAGSVPVRRSVAEAVSVSPALAEAYGLARNTPLIGAWSTVEFELMRSLALAYRWQPPAE